MKMKTISMFYALALGAALVVPQRAAAESAQSKLAHSVAEIRTETANTRDQLQATLVALNALTKQQKGDLRPTYNAYVAEVKKTHSAANWTVSRVTSMQGASKDYFGGWQAEINSINNESLRKKAQKRMNSVKKSYDNATSALMEAGQKFKPYLSDLDDVEKTLANDVTPGGVKAVKGTVSDANWNMKKVRSSIADALEELDDMQKSLTSQSNG